MSLLADAITWWLGHVGAPAAQANLIDPINAAFDALPKGFLGEATAGSGPTLTSAGTWYAGSGAAVTIVLTSTRRIRCDVQSRFNAVATTNARYDITAAYNTGGSVSIGSFVGMGQPLDVKMTDTGSSGGNTNGTALLTAGTYTFYPAAQRATNGSATDSASNLYVAVYDVGNS